ncbi:MAG: hypothetical protein ABI120_20070 [Gemmatimonadaceae bacterium]
MHLELVELLKCPVSHAPSVLVASADTVVNRYVTEGLLGCPVCHAEYEIRGGVTHFAAGIPALAALESRSAVTSSDNAGDTCDAAVRLAAQLGLRAGRSVFALMGYGMTTVMTVRDIVPARVLLLNPWPADPAAYPTEGYRSASLVAPIGIAMCSEILPLGPAKFDGIAVHAAHASPELLAQAANALRTGGRLVADVRTQLPAGVCELVRDEQVWVAERESMASAPVGITRR